MSKLNRRIFTVLAAGVCVSMLAAQVYAGSSSKVPVLFPAVNPGQNLIAAANQATPGQGKLKVNKKTGQATIKAKGTTNNRSNAALTFANESGNRFGIDAGFVCQYSVQANGKCKLVAVK